MKYFIVTTLSPTVTAHLSALSRFYDELSCGKQQLTEEEFLDCNSTFLAQQAVARRKQQSTATQTMLDTMFLALDADDNGYLSPKEWEVLFYMWNFPDFETSAVEAFKGADKNKDGQISPEEFLEYSVNLYIHIYVPIQPFILPYLYIWLDLSPVASESLPCKSRLIILPSQTAWAEIYFALSSLSFSLSSGCRTRIHMTCRTCMDQAFNYPSNLDITIADVCLALCCLAVKDQ